MTDVGDQPTPEIEPAEAPPGGVDAIEQVEYEVDAVVPDLGGAGNSTSTDDLPDGVTEPNDTGDGATTDGASEPEKESPA
jgi:hypothetical protein